MLSGVGELRNGAAPNPGSPQKDVGSPMCIPLWLLIYSVRTGDARSGELHNNVCGCKRSMKKLPIVNEVGQMLPIVGQSA